MALCVRDVTTFKHLCIERHFAEMQFPNEEHILSWTVGDKVTVAHDTENLFCEPWRDSGQAAFLWMCERASKKWSVFRRQCASIETFGSIYMYI